MIYLKRKIRFLTIAVFVILLAILLPTSTGFSQNHLRIEDRIGGNGSTSTSESSGNTALFVVGGLVVAGFIVYALFFKDKKEETESDTTTAINGLNTINVGSQFNSFEKDFEKTRDYIPVDVILGVRDEEAFISDRTYLIGVSVRF